MSFTGTVKNEITTLKLTETAKIALISGFFRNNYQIIKDSIAISSENERVHFCFGTSKNRTHQHYVSVYLQFLYSSEG